MEILLKALDIFIENKHWPELKPSEIFKILLYTFNKGWLYITRDGKEVRCFFCAYRIKEVNEDSLLNVPEKEDGNILYVPFFLSMNREENIFKDARESLRILLDKDKEIKELVLEDKNRKIKRYILKGESYEEQEIKFTESANVSK